MIIFSLPFVDEWVRPSDKETVANEVFPCVSCLCFPTLFFGSTTNTRDGCSMQNCMSCLTVLHEAQVAAASSLLFCFV